MKKILCLLLAVASLLLAGCTWENRDDRDGKIKVVATLFPQYDFARNIAGERMHIEILLPAGIDSHAFDPSVSDILKMNDADMVIYTGADMESWAQTFIDAADSDIAVLDLSEGFDMGHDHEEHGHAHEDPHIWTSPKNAMGIVVSICNAFCELDPAGAEYYRANADAYIKELQALSDTLEALSEGANDKTLYFGGKFSFHHLMVDYSFSYMTLYDGCSESAEPSAKRLTELTGLMKKENARVIFYPELSAGSAAQSIAADTGAKAVVLHSCHNLSQTEYEQGESYLSLMQKNLQKIEEAIS